MNPRNTLLMFAAVFALLLSACSAQAMPAGGQTGMTEDTIVEDAKMDANDDMPMDDKGMEANTMDDSETMESNETDMADESMEMSDEMASHEGDAAMEGEDMEMSDEMASHEEDAAMEGEDMEMSDEMASHEEGAAMESEEMKESEDMSTHDDDMMMADHAITLAVAGLEELGQHYAYEGWLIVDGAPTSTGVFKVDASGMLNRRFSLDADPAKATAFVLTIEPSPDSDPAPSSVHLLGGDLVDGVAHLSIGHPAALGTDFSSAGGTYIIGIGVPTSAGPANTYRNGIWFDNLNLPTLPAGWLYEGWVAGPDGPITTGKFASPGAMDQDGSGPYAAGPGSGPAFPGQDYLNPPLDLTAGYTVIISVEPDPDNSEAPFTLKPLVDSLIEDVGDHGSQALQTDSASFPTGSVTLTGE